jgi:DNA repair exonuclease SbcCD ATPase subunit
MSVKHHKSDSKAQEDVVIADAVSRARTATIRGLREENELLKAVIANPTDFTEPEGVSTETKLLVAGIKIRCQVFHTEIANLNREIANQQAQTSELERKVAANRFYLDDLSQQRIEVQRLQHELSRIEDNTERTGIAEKEAQRSKAEAERLQRQLNTMQDHAQRCHIAEQQARRLQVEVNRLRPLESEVLRLRAYEQEANSLRPQIGQLRDTIRGTERSKKTAEERVSVLEAESKTRSLRFAHIQQILVEARMKSKRKSALQVRATKDKSKERPIRNLQLQLAGLRAQLSRQGQYKNEAEQTRRDAAHLRKELEATQQELDTSKSFVHALQERLQNDAFSSALNRAQRL